MRTATPRERIAALADPGTLAWLDSPRPSPYLAQRGIEPHADDGVVTARVQVHGRAWLVAAQDERFLAGSVGAAHGEALRALFEQATRAPGQDAARPGVLLLLASGGVRLHEANAAELALGRALRAAVDARAHGVPLLALAVGDVFGGTSVLACAADALAALPGTRLGLSGPKVLEAAAGAAAFDARDTRAVQSLYSMQARVAAGQVAGVPDDVDAIVRWIAQAAAPEAFVASTLARQRALTAASTPPAPLVGGTGDVSARVRPLPPSWQGVHLGGGLWRAGRMHVVAAFGDAPVDAASLTVLDAALLAHVGAHRAADAEQHALAHERGAALDAAPMLVLLEDSRGHAATPAAERAFLSRYLAHHACVLGVLRGRGVRTVGVLAGVGHSAAFFANALQADALLALPGARVVAMNPDALARVTGLDAARAVEDDPMLGHPVRHFAALGGIAAMLDDPSPASVESAGRMGSG
jgi:malonate decarboxylase beta subunit